MTSKTDILTALQYPIFNEKDPLNETGDARKTITWQYAGTSAPTDLDFSAYSGWTAFTAAEKAAYEAVLDHIETFLNVDFVEVSGAADPDLNVGQITIPGSTIGLGGYSVSYSGDTIVRWDGFVLFDNTLDLSLDAQTSLLLHEMGHALGLKHTFEAPALLGDEDTHKYSVMAYDSNPDNGERSDAMMLYDTYALQDIWGSVDYLTGNTSYTGSRTDTVDTIWDTGGKDTLDASAKTGDVILDLNEGGFSTFDSYPDVVIAFGVEIENATGGSGDDTITGNDLNNLLKGNGGIDTIVGGRGHDRIKGGDGNDDLTGDNGNDTLWGNDGADVLLGLKNDDVLKGGDGDDELKGGHGDDTLSGQAGDDKLVGNAGADRFIYAIGDDKDKITDFEDGVDSIRIRDFGDTAAVLAQASETGGHVVFNFGGGDVLKVFDTTLAEISDDILT